MGRSIEVQVPALKGFYDKPTDLTTDKPTKRQPTKRQPTDRQNNSKIKATYAKNMTDRRSQYKHTYCSKKQ